MLAKGASRGSISAHAEETPACSPESQRRRVHLRARGGDFLTRPLGDVEQGPSPRTRRRRGFGNHLVPQVGSISAHAEETTLD